MADGISKLGASLIAIFALCVAIIAADLAYVLWRRKRFNRRSSAVESVVSGEDPSSFYVLSSKELLYFFCWKNNHNQSRIEPNSEISHQQVNAVEIIASDAHRSPEIEKNENDPIGVEEEEEESDDVLKLHEMYGRSRVLFTIKEEEIDNIDRKSVSSSSSSLSSSDGHDLEMNTDDVEVPAVYLTVVDNQTPFSTPCASPPYYTPSPSPSPSRDDLTVMRSYGSYGEVYLEAIGV